jgi:dipeptidyl aminopeptidase/acylaminoacyl peptidase
MEQLTKESPAVAKHEPYTISELEERAAQFFDRPGYGMPAWLDNRRLAILDDRSGVPQLALLDVTSGHAVPATSFGERFLSLVVAADGTIVFGMDTGGDERQQIWKIDPATAQPVRITHQPESRFEPSAVSADGALVLATSNARDNGMFDIVGIDLVSGETEMWIQESGTATATALSKDGSSALIKQLNTNLDASLLLVDRETKQTRVLNPHDGEAWIFDAAFGPGESTVWFLTNEGRDFVRLEQIDLATETREVIVEDEWDVEAFALSPTGTHVAYALNLQGWSVVSILELADGAEAVTLSELPRGTVDRFSWSPDGTTVAFGFSTATDPSSIVIAQPDGTWDQFGGESSTVRPSVVEPELVQFTTFDDRSVPGFLFKPEGDGPFPVLVEIHGGPESQRRLQYSSAVPTNQFIQSLGIAVLSLNVRGSTGYGKSYSHLDDRDLRLDSVKDAVAAVEWLKSRDDVIGDRIGVMGQSYGGFMTLASIAFHPGRWSAAVDVVGIANFVSFLERTGAWRRKHRSEEYGFLETDREMLERISPLNHVDQIDTPLFVLHGRNDPRVPLYEAEQIVTALEQRGREVALRVFDNEGHGLSKKQNRITGYAEAAAFLVRHLLA